MVYKIRKEVKMEPIRILHVVTYMGRGGLETMLMNYYRHIDRNKVQFDFLVHRDFEADYDQEIEELGGRIYRVSRLIPWSKKYRLELKKFFQTHPEYKIVHVHQDCLSSVALQCAKECGVTHRIAHSHSSNQDKNIKYLIKKHYMKQIPMYATDLFACGEEAGEWMFRTTEFLVLNNAIDTKKYIYNSEKAEKSRESFGILRDAYVVGHVGRFAATKNHEFLVKVFVQLQKKEVNARLLLVGDGELHEQIEKQVKDLGVADKVIFTGVRSDVEELLQAMDVFVFPSIYEGLPVSLIEAQAAGLPCVISDKVPLECIKTDLVQQISLDVDMKEWTQRILSVKNQARKNYSKEIENAGFDIVSNAKWLEDYYIGLLSDEKKS